MKTNKEILYLPKSVLDKLIQQTQEFVHRAIVIDNNPLVGEIMKNRMDMLLCIKKESVSETEAVKSAKEELIAEILKQSREFIEIGGLRDSVVEVSKIEEVCGKNNIQLPKLDF